MTSVWLFRIALFTLPFLCLRAWLWWRERQETPSAALTPVLLTLMLTLCLVLGIVLAVIPGDAGAPGSVYTPAHLEDGHVVPGRMTPPE